MRPRNIALLAGTAAAALTLAGVVIALPASAAELLSNPGFETGNANNWSCEPSAAVTSGAARSGSYKLAGTPGGATARCQQTVSVQPNTKYTFSGYVNGSYVFIGVTGGVDASTWTPGTGGAYSQLSVAFTTGAAQTSAVVYVHGWYGQPAYTADDFSLSGPGGTPPTTLEPTTPSASPSRSTSPSPSVSPSASKSPSTSPSPSTSTPPSPLPKHFLTGYWQDFVNSAAKLKLRDTPSEYDLIDVAFAETGSQPGQLTFAVDPQLAAAVGGYTDAEFKSDIATLHARGKKVILSVGGEAGRVSVGDATAATNFANSAWSLMQQYGFDGIDIDLENGLNPTYMAQALRSLRAKAGANLIITMAPQTIDMQSTGGSYFALALSIKDILTVVYTQFYNSGSMLGCDQMAAYSQGTVNFMTALACIQLENGLRPDQVALGLPAGPGAAGGGVVAPALVNQALSCLATGSNCGTFKPPHTYPGIRGAMTWSINWDVTNGNNFARTVKPHLATLP
ncbi:glycosyl hydrolase family 18 protein [Dactylosporangium sp. NBC_01737]|uniref:chitinase n=1 Tax=Dactylosporangium sp. NBC_01737 TaxID=2975959 RepID=UPI002E10F347|nr:glycosyl hydrolase family 18 protein [Dactylosporangium sp. NBC_01737]